MSTAQTSHAVGSTLVKRIIESTSTSSRSPEDILARQDQYDVAWYITDEGDLLIKSWQVAAEDFVPVEHVARVRANHPVPAEADVLEWLSRHMDELRALHGGHWVGITGNRVVASSPTLPGLMEALQQVGAEAVFVTQIPAEPIVWRSVYGAKVI